MSAGRPTSTSRSRRRTRDPDRFRTAVLVALVLVGVPGILAMTAMGAAPSPTASGMRDQAQNSPAVSVQPVGPLPSSVVVGVATMIGWETVASGGARVPGFSVSCNLSVVADPSGRAVRAWVNLSASEPLSISSNGAYSVPASGWSNGVLNLTVATASSGPVSVQLWGAGLPSTPTPVNYTVVPDLDHLVLFGPTVRSNETVNATSTQVNQTFWHVRDRFGDPVPGAYLNVVLDVGTSSTEQAVPVTWANATTTGAWVNYSIPLSTGGTVRVLDLANATLLGPIVVPAAVVVVAAATVPTLPAAEMAAVAVLAVAGVVGMVALTFGGRSTSTTTRTDDEADLRRLAEGRATVVELLRRGGPLTLNGVETAWEPGPAPAAVADWLASLVTDGTLNATIGEDGQARFALVERAVEEPKVTFDEATLAREIARRDRAVEGDDEDDAGRPPP